MILITIILSILLQRYLNIGKNWDRQVLIGKYIHGLNRLFGPKTMDGVAGVLLILLPSLVIIFLIEILIGGWLFGLIALLFYWVVLLYCISAYDIRTQLKAYFHAIEVGDHESAYLHVKDRLRVDTIENSGEITRAVTKEMLIGANRRLFAVLFWFIILGPWGAVLYFMVDRCQNLPILSEQLLKLDRILNKVQQLLDWIPARLTALSFALIGHFIPAFQAFSKEIIGNLSSSYRLLVDVGLQALQVPAESREVNSNENQKVIGLVDRAVVVWIVVVALFTIASILP